MNHMSSYDHVDFFVYMNKACLCSKKIDKESCLNTRLKIFWNDFFYIYENLVESRVKQP